MKLKDVLKIMIVTTVNGVTIDGFTTIKLLYREPLIKKLFNYQDLNKNIELLDVEIASIISITTTSVRIDTITLDVKE